MKNWNPSFKVPQSQSGEVPIQILPSCTSVVVFSTCVARIIPGWLAGSETDYPFIYRKCQEYFINAFGYDSVEMEMRV